MKCLVFDTELKAKDALATINNNMGLPKVGINAKTGKPNKSAVQTTSWATIEQRSDGKYFMCRPDSKHMADVNFDAEAESQDNWQQYDDKFNLVINKELKL